MNKKLLPLVLSLLLTLSANSFAGTSTATMQSTVTLNASCSITTLNYNFANYIAQNSVTFSPLRRYVQTCSNGIVGTVTLSGGNSGNVMDRTMIGSVSGDKLHYNIVQTASTTGTVVGDGTQGSVSLTANGTGGAVSSPIGFYYIVANQYVTPDNYSDSITMTITY